jgi:hypothetical protein
MLNQVKIDSLQAFRTFCTILLNYLLRRCNKKFCCSFLRFDCITRKDCERKSKTRKDYPGPDKLVSVLRSTACVDRKKMCGKRSNLTAKALLRVCQEHCLNTPQSSNNDGTMYKTYFWTLMKNVFEAW